MQSLLILILSISLLGFSKPLPVEPYAETPWMDNRVFNPSVFQTQNMLDHFSREVQQTLPYNQNWVYGNRFRQNPHFMGSTRREIQAEVLRKQTEFIMGNEVGDPLYLELNPDVKVQNRTPMMGFSFYYPCNNGDWQAAYEQVDHFGTSDLSYRNSVIQEEGELEESFSKARAWFGGNLPHYSFISVGRNFKTKKFSRSLFFKKGWFWAQNPYTGVETPTELNQMVSILAWEGFQFEHVIQKFVESPKDSVKEYWANDAKLIWGGRWGLSKGLTLGGHINYNADQDEKAHLIPFVNLNYKYKNLTWAGENGMGFGFFYIKDTLKWEVAKDSSLLGVKARSYIEWSVSSSNQLNPMLSNLQAKQQGDSYERYNSSSFWIHYAMKSGSLKKKKLLGRDLKIEFWLEPYMHVQAMHFIVDSLWEQSGRILRNGHYGNLESELFGLKGNLFLDYELLDSLQLNLSVTGEDFYGKAWSQMDFRAPRRTLSLGLSYQLVTGLHLYPTWVYQSDYYVRGWGESFKVEEHLESNIKIEQVLVEDKWSVSLHMLNYLETGIKEHPNGADNRFRLFVGSKYLF
jgi:hypothetical protein